MRKINNASIQIFTKKRIMPVRAGKQPYRSLSMPYFYSNGKRNTLQGFSMKEKKSILEGKIVRKL